MKKIVLLTSICGLIGTTSAMDQTPLDEQRQQQQQDTHVTLVFDTQPPQRLTIARLLANTSTTLKSILADLPPQGEIPVVGEHAAGITWLCKYHTGLSDQARCSELLNELKAEDLGRVTSAAHYLEITGVSDTALATVGKRLMEDHNLQDNFLMSKQPEAYRPFGMQDSLLKLALHQKKPLHNLLDDLKSRVEDPDFRACVAFSDDGSKSVVVEGYGAGSSKTYKSYVFESWKKRNLGLGKVDVAVFAPDNKELFIGGQYGIVIIDSSSKGAWKWIQRFDDGAAVTAIAKLSSDRLVAGTNRHILKSFKKNTDGSWKFDQILSNRHRKGLAQLHENVIAYITTDNHIEVLRHDPQSDSFVKEGDFSIDQTPFVGIAFDAPRNLLCFLNDNGQVALCKQDATGQWRIKSFADIIGDIREGGYKIKEQYNSLSITRDGSMMVVGSDKKTRLLRHEVLEDDARITLKLREFATLSGIDPVMSADGTKVYIQNHGSYTVDSSAIEASGANMTFAQLYLLMIADAKKTTADQRGIDIADYPNLKSLYNSFHPALRSHGAHLVCESATINEVRTSTHNKMKRAFTGLFGSAKK